MNGIIVYIIISLKCIYFLIPNLSFLSLRMYTRGGISWTCWGIFAIKVCDIWSFLAHFYYIVLHFLRGLTLGVIAIFGHNCLKEYPQITIDSPGVLFVPYLAFLPQ